MKKGTDGLQLNSFGKRIISAVILLAGCAVCVFVILGIRGAALKREKQKVLRQRGEVEILVLGDSIWDLERGETGIAALLQEELPNVAVYNCAVKGSRAAEDEYGLWAMAEHIACRRKISFPADAAAGDILGEVEFENIDYIFIAYGLNDYFGAVKRKNPDDCYDVSTYEGALCSAIELLRESCPGAEFVILSPTYCQGYSYGQVVHESTEYDYGGGTGADYAASAERIAEAYGDLFIDNYRELGISIHNGAAYLEDATHLTEKGRRAYAENLAAHLVGTWQEGGDADE